MKRVASTLASAVLGAAMLHAGPAAQTKMVSSTMTYEPDDLKVFHDSFKR